VSSGLVHHHQPGHNPLPQHIVISNQNQNGTASLAEINLRALAQGLSQDHNAFQTLHQLSLAFQAEDEDQMNALLGQINSQPGSSLAKLISTHVDNITTTLSGSLSDAHITAIAGVRSKSLEKLSKYVCATEEPPPAPVQRAIGKLVSGKPTLMRLLEVVNIQHNNFSAADPLSALASVTNCDAVFSTILARASLALQYSFPAAAAATAQFFVKLKDYIDRQRKRGASWSTLSPYYAALMRKIEFESKSSGSIVLRMDWVDQHSEFVAALHQKMIDDKLSNVGASHPHLPKKPRSEPRTKSGPGPKPGSADPKSTGGKPADVPLLKLSEEEYKKAIAEVNEAYEKKGDLRPCVNFFYGGLKCSKQHLKQHTEMFHHDTRLKKTG
jgi:hypothetical protein